MRACTEDRSLQVYNWDEARVLLEASMREPESPNRLMRSQSLRVEQPADGNFMGGLRDQAGSLGFTASILSSHDCCAVVCVKNTRPPIGT